MTPSHLVNVFIRQLTGIRFVAAAWVLLYHLQGPLNTLGVLSIPILPEVMRVGRLGVDLFFALSGFILTHTYLTRLGPRLAGRKTIDFWWLRLARVYPVHLVMLVIAGVAVFAQAKLPAPNSTATGSTRSTSARTCCWCRSGGRARSVGGTSSPGHYRWSGSPT